MRQDSFILFFDIFFSGKILSFLVDFLSKSKRYKKYRIFGFLLSALLLLSIHIFYFISQKESNFFEILNIPRVFSPEMLENRVSELKLLKKTAFYNNTIRLSQIKEILGNSALKNSYDKFNKRKFDKKEEMLSIIQRFQMILYQKVFENSIYYVIMTIIILISADDENSRKSQKWVIFTMVFFYFTELSYLFLNNNQKDFIDLIFPFMSIFERIQLQRDLLMSILYIIKYRYKFFFVDELAKVQKKMMKNSIAMRGIRGAIENLWGKAEGIERIQRNLEGGVEILGEFLKRKGLEKKKEANNRAISDNKGKEKKAMITEEKKIKLEEKVVKTEEKPKNPQEAAPKPYIADVIKQYLGLFLLGIVLYKLFRNLFSF